MKTSVAILGILTACGGDPAPARSERPAPPVPMDSLVLTTGDGTEIWFAGAMHDSAASGEPCVAHAVQIRRDGHTTPVPLFYATEAPTVHDDSTIRATLVRHCAPAGTYLVHLGTGQPERVE